LAVLSEIMAGSRLIFSVSLQGGCIVINQLHKYIKYFTVKYLKILEGNALNIYRILNLLSKCVKERYISSTH